MTCIDHGSIAPASSRSTLASGARSGRAAREDRLGLYDVLRDSPARITDLRASRVRRVRHGNATVAIDLPAIVTRIFSPGVITAVTLFLPIGVWAYRGASRDGALGSVAVSGVPGFVLTLFPIVLQMTKRKPFLRQEQLAG